jgi:non-specific serine/threonine protein kinase
MPTNPNKLSQFWQELKRRKVLPFLIGYMAACFAIIEFSSITSDTFSIPENTVKLIYIIAAIGLPVVILLPWYINRKKPKAVSDDLGASEPNSKSDIPATPEKSIIVLPFENISPDPDQEYFSDGLTEEIITDLSHINDLLVISRSSSMIFKGTKKTIKEIAEEVNVKYILEGSVRKAGNNLRIVAQLIDASSDSHLWAEKYSGTLDDIFNIQEKVSSSIADALKIKLTSVEKQKILGKQIDNIDVYDIYIKAQQASKSFTEVGLKQALKYINQGLEIIGDNDKLYALMGATYLSFIEMGIDRDKSIFKKVEECTEKVFSLNPDSSDGYYLRGHVQRWHGDVIGSIKNYNKALSVEPNDFWANFYRSWNYSFSGYGEVASDSISRILNIDPLNPFSNFIAGTAEVWHGRFDQAHDFMRKAFEMVPNPFFGWWLSKILAYGNRIDEAYKVIDQFSDMADDEHWAKLGVIFKYALEGKEEKVLELYTEKLKNMMRGDEFYGVWVAESYALINHKQEALEWLEEAINNQLLNYPFLTKHDRFLKNLHNEQGFKKLMKRVKIEWENFEV